MIIKTMSGRYRAGRLFALVPVSGTRSDNLRLTLAKCIVLEQNIFNQWRMIGETDSGAGRIRAG
jgi:hypothetical protein